MITSKHGLSKHPLYKVWDSMKTRCWYPSHKDYMNYGGRGITVCDRWLTFKNFYDDMINGWSPNLQLDRIDVNGNYEHLNCRWVTPSTNAKNRRNKSVHQSKIDFVSYHKQARKWLVIKRFDTQQEAEEFASKLASS